MDNVASTFGEALAIHAAHQPAAIALRFGAAAIDYATFDRHATQIANALLATAAPAGSRIAYIGKNSDLAIELALGVARAGMVFVPIIWRLTAAEIEVILRDCGPVALFVEPGFVDRVPGGGEAPATIVLMGDDGGDPAWPHFTRWRDAAPATRVPVVVQADDVVLQLYTSGTTGQPKGVMLSHANATGIRSALRAANLPWLFPAAPETILVAMPYGHIGGVGGVLLATLDGSEMVIQPEFNAGAFLEAIEVNRIRRLFLVPAALKILLEHPRAAVTDFSSLEYFSYGSSPIPLDLLHQGLEALKCSFIQLYGLTESWGTATALPPEDHHPDRLRVMASAGKAVPGVELRIVDEAGTPLPSGTIGEILIRSPSTMKGYWNRPEDTAHAVLPGGWLRTGDAGLLDAEGYLFIQDRMKDMIITGAENVYPAEVESAIYGHADVADVAVIGVPDDRWGEAVKAIVVLKPGRMPDPASVIAFARTRIAGFKCPKSIDFVETLPRNPAGKILRRALREPYWAGRERGVN